MEVAINKAIGIEVDESEYSDPELLRIMQASEDGEFDVSFIFDIRDIWDLQVKRKKGSRIPYKILAYLESGVTIDIKVSEFDEMLEIWRKRTFKRRQ